MALLALVLLAGCRAPAEPSPPARLQIAGSTSLRPALIELSREYTSRHPNISIEVAAGGSQIGLDALLAGKADLAAVSWWPDGTPPPKGYRAYPIARDAIVVIVHPSNALAGVTILQMRAIYEGQVLDWADLGGPPGELIVVSREEGSGTRQAFTALVLGDAQVTLNALVMPTSQAVVDYVASHRTAVGYVTMAAVSDRVRVVPIEDSLPTAADVRSGAYHLTRLLYLFSAHPPAPAVQSFLDFVLSPAGQAIIARYHVPLH